MKKINPDEVRNRGFKFYDGLSDSNVPFYEVRVGSQFAIASVLMIYSIQHPPKTKGWESTGVVIYIFVTNVAANQPYLGLSSSTP